MSFSNMFRYICTTFRQNIMQVLKNQVLLQSCYLCVSWSAAASPLMVIICKRYNCTAVPFVLPEDGAHIPKHVGEVHLLCVLINNAHLVGIKMLHAYVKNVRKGDNFKIQGYS